MWALDGQCTTSAAKHLHTARTTPRRRCGIYLPARLFPYLPPASSAVDVGRTCPNHMAHHCCVCPASRNQISRFEKGFVAARHYDGAKSYSLSLHAWRHYCCPTRRRSHPGWRSMNSKCSSCCLKLFSRPSCCPIGLGWQLASLHATNEEPPHADTYWWFHLCAWQMCGSTTMAIDGHCSKDLKLPH